MRSADLRRLEGSTAYLGSWLRGATVIALRAPRWVPGRRVPLKLVCAAMSVHVRVWRLIDGC